MYTVTHCILSPELQVANQCPVSHTQISLPFSSCRLSFHFVNFSLLGCILKFLEVSPLLPVIRQYLWILFHTLVADWEFPVCICLHLCFLSLIVSTSGCFLILKTWDVHPFYLCHHISSNPFSIHKMQVENFYCVMFSIYTFMLFCFVSFLDSSYSFNE